MSFQEGLEFGEGDVSRIDPASASCICKSDHKALFVMAVSLQANQAGVRNSHCLPHGLNLCRWICEALAGINANAGAVPQVVLNLAQRIVPVTDAVSKRGVFPRLAVVWWCRFHSDVMMKAERAARLNLPAIPKIRQFYFVDILRAGMIYDPP